MSDKNYPDKENLGKNNQLRNKTISNMIWRFAERCGAQGVAFVVSIVLARLLTPTEYGMMSLFMWQDRSSLGWNPFIMC